MKAPTSAPEPRPSGRLSPRSRRFRTKLLATYDFARHELELLDRTLEERDLADRCSAIIEREGLTVDGKAHPLLAVRRDALQTAARTWRQLRFVAPSAGPPRARRVLGAEWHAARQLRRLNDAEP
jgi:hypothetical protein